MKLKLLLLSFLFIIKLNAQVDTIPPVITMNGPDTVRSAVYMHYTDPGATAFDLKDGNVSVTKTSLVDTANIGVFLVTYNAHDAAGNQAIPKKRIVIIIDTIPPIITLVGPDTVVLCKDFTNIYIDPGYTLTDNYDKGVTTAIYTGSVDVFKYGFYPIFFTAVDKSGNVAIPKRRIVAVTGNCITASIFFDKNKNCSYDKPEDFTPEVHLNFKNMRTQKTTIIHPDNIGTFSINAILDTGNYLVKVMPAKPYIKVACAKDSFYFTKTLNLDTMVNIPITDTMFNDLSASFYPAIYTRWNTKNALPFTLNNKGRSDVLGAKVQLILPNGIQITSSNPNYDSLAGNIVYWHLDTFKPGVPAFSYLEYKADTSIYKLNDTFSFQLRVISNLTEVDVANNFDNLKKRVVGSYDPNEKSCEQPAIVKANTTDFNFTVQFQNTGNAEAFDVVVKDTIDSRFDLNSLQITEASHRQRMFIQDNILTVRFEEINLPDNKTNEPKSHGFFSYSVKLKKPLSLNEEIKNTAYIYFDNNQPIVTNTTSNKYILSGIKINSKTDMVVYPNPAANIVNVPNDGNEKIFLFDLLGHELLSTNASSFDVSNLPNGVYIIRRNQSFTKLIKE